MDTRQRVLLFVTGITRWEIFLLGTEIDRGTGESGDTIDMLKVRNRFTIAERAGRFDLLYRVG